MDVAAAVDWTQRTGRAWGMPSIDDQVRAIQLTRENRRLAEENDRLRTMNADLAASAEIWIRLYEAALARTARPAPVHAASDRFAPWKDEGPAVMSYPNDKTGKVPARPYVDVRATRRVRLIDHGGSVTAYPEPHRTPVLPSGWAPLTREQQDAVLEACDAAPQCVVFRIGSLWDPEAEYRVYRLTDEHWAGLWVASRYVTGTHDDAARPSGENRQLLGLGVEAAHVVQLTVDFFNWDLEAHGEQWRLRATPPPPVDNDPRR